jgi:hypothetical protein
MDIASQVHDRLELADLAVRYIDVVNRRRPESLGDVFAPDGEWYVPGYGWLVGVETIASTLRGILGGYPQMMQTVHGNLVRVEGDRGYGRCYITEWARDAEGFDVHMAGLYMDEMVRTDAGWRFAKRRFEFMRRGRAPAVGKVYDAPEIPDWPPSAPRRAT